MNDTIIARALHVLFVVIWIGGVSMVTTVVLPAIARGSLGEDRIKAFKAVKSRFVWQARTAVIMVGATGLYMVVQLDLWGRFYSANFWWMHAMVCVWLLFAFILFIGEPFILHRRSARKGPVEPVVLFKRLQRIHWILLILSLVTVFGAVAGSQGWLLF